MPIKKYLSLLPLILIFSLTACMSLAEDVTPPPGMEAPPPSMDTPAPRPTATPLGPVFPQQPPDPNQGAPIYAEKCALCHGETGLGDGTEVVMVENPVAALGLAEVARPATPAAWFRLITQGDLSKFMPPFSNLSDSQRWDLVAYLFTLSAPPQTIEQGSALYLQHCAACHGEDGSQGAVDFRDQAYMSEQSAEAMFNAISTGPGEMPAFDQLSEDNRWALTAYLRSLTFSSQPEPVMDSAENDETEPGTVVETETELVEEPPADGVGTITVEVINNSDAELPAFDITLRGYDDMVEVYTRTLTLADSTSITFEEVPFPPERMYFASTEYASAIYGSDILEIDSSSPAAQNLRILYYPPTSDPSILQVDRLHIFFSFVSEQILEVFHLYIFSNPTNQVLTPEEGAETAVDFTIPAIASNLYVEDNMSMAYRKTDNGFGIVNVYPDENAYQVVYSYQVPYEDHKLDLSIPIGMDAGAVIVMAPSNGFKIRSDQLVDAGMRDVEGVSYSMFTGGDLRAGNNLDLSLSGFPKEDTQLITTEPGSNNSLVIGLAGFGVALIAAGVFIWLRNRSVSAGDEAEIEADTPEDTREDLMDSIIALDDQFRAGEIPQEAYRVRRAELKQRLRDLVESTNG